MSENKPSGGYQVDDQELLLGFYKKLLWDWLVPRIPHAITPNALTVMGQLMAVAGAFAAGIATTGYPALYAVAAVLFLGYLTADNCDGPHARRTGRTSPLGEFLDHGLDGSASTCIILATCFMLQLDGVLMVTFCGIAALGFIVVFWEQFRTGLLIIPKVSTTEGVTLLAVCLIAIAIAGEPEWMRFSLEAMTPGTILVLAVLIGYTAACVPPIVRVWKKGTSPLELVPVMLVLAGQVFFIVLGADAIMPSIAAGLVGGDITCRIIVLRHRGQRGPVMSPLLYLSLVPLAIGALARSAWTPDGWAAASLGAVVTSYGVVLVRGGRELLARARARAATPG